MMVLFAARQALRYSTRFASSLHVFQRISSCHRRRLAAIASVLNQRLSGCDEASFVSGAEWAMLVKDGRSNGVDLSSEAVW